MNKGESGFGGLGDALLGLLAAWIFLALLWRGTQSLQIKVQELIHSTTRQEILFVAASILTILIVVFCIAWNAWLKRQEIECVSGMSKESVYLGKELPLK